MTKIILFDRSSNKKKEAHTLRDQLERMIYIMEGKRYQAYQALHEILKDAERQNVSLEESHIQKYLKVIFEKISLDSRTAKEVYSSLTVENLKERFQKLDEVIENHHEDLKKLKKDSTFDSLQVLDGIIKTVLSHYLD